MNILEFKITDGMPNAKDLARLQSDAQFVKRAADKMCELRPEKAHKYRADMLDALAGLNATAAVLAPKPKR